MAGLALVTPIFLGMGVILLVLAGRESFKAETRRELTQRTWLQVGLIFVAIGVFLYFTIRPVP
jgi:predicted membrane channel-forming protein YqfA (hemolysin III family)